MWEIVLCPQFKWWRGHELGLLAHDLDDEAFAALAVKLGVVHLLPGPKSRRPSVTGKMTSWPMRSDFKCESPLVSPVMWWR